ncbi:hypothetical protein [Amaricoccus sp.]|uniref:hypothetical protein n=1 Tax=Amaricoccus sp. TaxID=1872485 RepID=UPI00260CBABB|nr:hypothetical protein [uncultured Amaricoccus sp.]
MKPARALLGRLGLRDPKPSAQRLLHEDAALKVTAIDRPAARTLVLCFTGVGHALGGIDTQRAEFVGTMASLGAASAFVFDKTRSWGNRVDFARVAELVAPLAPGARILGLGNSMGGFNAILMSNFVAMETCVAFAPQFSVMPGVVPGESRWRDYVAAIEDFRFPSLAGRFNARTRYVTMNGDGPAERAHWSRFPAPPNARHLVVRGLGHDAAAGLKAAGVLGPFLAAAFEGRDPARALAGRVAWTDHGSGTGQSGGETGNLRRNPE